MDSNKNFLLFAVLSIVIIIGSNYLLPKPKPAVQVPASTTSIQTIPGAPAVTVTLRDRGDVVKESPRLPIATPELSGSINLKGARFDDLTLAQFRETTDPQSPPVILLSPAGSAFPHNAQYADFGWLSDNKDVAVPGADTEWKADSKGLSPDHPVRLTWKNEQGLSFEREIAIDEHYMFTVTDRVTNTGNDTVKLYPYGVVARQGDPSMTGSRVLYEGPLGVLGGTLSEFKYKDLMDAGKKTMDSDGGWLGISSKYWLVAMVPPADEKLTADFAFDGTGATAPKDGHFQSDYRGVAITVAPGSTNAQVIHFFAGAKKIRLLDGYADKYNIPHFDRAIDFGWFYFLTKPFLYMLSFLSHSLGSFGIAILVFTVMLKLITLPLSLKSNHSMARMKTLQPELKRLQERYADDKMRYNQEMMELFKREKVSPMSGCVPMLIQIPIFFALYKVLYVGIEMRQAPFFGWIHDMSLPDPTSVLTAFGAIPYQLPVALHIGVWPILMGCSMFMQQKLSPQAMDKSQARMFQFMPVLFTYMLASMPAGLVIYWTWSNLLSILQQWYISKKDANRVKA